MTGPKLHPWQRAYLPTEEERASLAREYATDCHVPARTCLGCGGSRRDGWYGQCHSWGVEAWRTYGKPADDASPIYSECFRLSWAEVARLAAAEGIQQELFA